MLLLISILLMIWRITSYHVQPPLYSRLPSSLHNSNDDQTGGSVIVLGGGIEEDQQDFAHHDVTQTDVVCERRGRFLLLTKDLSFPSWVVLTLSNLLACYSQTTPAIRSSSTHQTSPTHSPKMKAVNAGLIATNL